MAGTVKKVKKSSFPPLPPYLLVSNQHHMTYLVNFPSKKSLNFLVLVIFSGKAMQKSLKVKP